MLIHNTSSKWEAHLNYWFSDKDGKVIIIFLLALCVGPFHTFSLLLIVVDRWHWQQQKLVQPKQIGCHTINDNTDYPNIWLCYSIFHMFFSFFLFFSSPAALCTIPLHLSFILFYSLRWVRFHGIWLFKNGILMGVPYMHTPYNQTEWSTTCFICRPAWI